MKLKDIKTNMKVNIISGLYEGRKGEVVEITDGGIVRVLLMCFWLETLNCGPEEIEEIH